MKIIAYGLIAPEVEECPECKCLFSYMPSETMTTNRKDSNIKYVVCPVCSYNIHLKTIVDEET